MAEFKLGRIKFVWKGAWTTATTYYVDDVIRHGGKTFICVIGHTAAGSFYTDLNNVPARWNQFTDGQDWKGNWTSTTLYKINDIVKYGGYVYICNTGHTSASTLETDQLKWTLFAEGFDWKGNWNTSTTYKVNDIVKYGGNVYLCNNAHTSDASASLGLEQNNSDWDLFNEGLNWNGDWNVSTRYKVNDIVKYGGQIYVCNAAHTSAATVTLGLENDQGSWDYFSKGLEYKGTWSAASVRYKVNDLVKYGPGVWICTGAHTSSVSFDVGNFSLFTEGIEYENIYSGATTYQPGDIVRYGGYSYIAKAISFGILPTSTSNWDLFTTNFSFVGDYSGATSYKVGEVIRHGGYTYVAVADGTGQTPPNLAYWERLNSGLRWRGEWANSTGYILGDIVLFGQFSYICVQAHTSDDDDSTITPTNNSPGKDIAGVYWNLLTSGLEESVLTTKGDLVYFSEAGVTRLPIGEEGQVLVVENGIPSWKNWGITEQVYYVAIHGVDEPAPTYGTTVDKPWRTIRYATDQIEKGTHYPDAAYLLKQNRTFIQKEIVEWTDYQIANNIAPFTGAFTYNKAKCQRDMGLLLDALTWDLSHGGNVESIDVARSYFTPLGASYIAGQEDETVASINYGISLIEDILNNEAPAANYQALNGIGAGNRIKQIIDFGFDSEDGTYTAITNLAEIVTDAITAGNLNSVPTTRTPGYTIFVKTGLFEEVLPIIVPANTAIVGDELRSTKVSPAPKLIASADKAKSLATLTHLRSITDDVIQNLAVAPTTGNTVTQDTFSQKAGDVGSTTAVNSVIANATEIKDIIANNTPNAYVYPAPTNWGTSLVDTAYASTGYPTGNTSGFDDGRRLLLANKAFLQSEVSAWILAQIAGAVAPFVGFSYSGTRQTKCERDVGLIVDAVAYDMTYGGNLATQIAARSYYSLGSFVEPSEEKAPSLAVMDRIKDIIDNICIGNTGGWTKTTVLVQDTSGTPGSADSGAFAQDRIQQIRNTINTGTEPTTSAPYTAWVASALVSARTAINDDRALIQSDAVQYIKRTFPTLVFDETLCSRDVGYIVDALGYDLMFGSNFLSIQSGLSYRRGTTSTLVVLSQQLAPQLAIIDFISLKVSEIATSGAVVFADLLWSYIIGIVTAEALPVNTGRNTPTTNLDMINGANILRLNADFFAAEATAYANNTFKATVSASNGGTDTFTCSSQTWMVAGDTVRFSGTTFGGVNTTTTYYILSSGLTATTFKVSLTPGGTAVDLSGAAGSMTVTWYYDSSRCQNDVRSYINAVADDMTYTGNYYVTYASRYYLRALRGSKLEDMYYVRNGCGIRNQTLLGLDGSSNGNDTGVTSPLTTANEFGTSRPKAGAYVSLDPGWGPNDTKVWVTNKSTYVQNVTTFGIGAIGQKVDGSLHAGGNDSIVSNDFTQVISDGIGAWVTNLGRAELVSVFSYYAHIGYLAENGGKIRATNGNNSYGDFGSVSEGVDPTETPVTGLVNNRGNEANVQNVITSGSNVLMLEYGNAGINYTTASYTISGSGLNAAAIGNEVRDGGVYQVRLTDPGDSSGPGGAGYLTASNNAQTGTTTQITLSATDTALSTAYVGMSIYITAGTGAGQYGFINTFNSGSKVATVRKESDGTAGWDHVVPGTTIVGSLDLTTVYTITPRVTFTAPPYTKSVRTGLTNAQWTDVVFGAANGSYTNVVATGGAGSSATFDVTRVSGVYTVTISAAGFNYVAGNTLTIAGTLLGGTSPANDITVTADVVADLTGGILEISYTGTAISQQWVAVASGTNQAYSSPDGITWTARTLPATANWSAVSYGVVNNIGYWVAVARNVSTFAYSTNGTTWTISGSVDSGEPWDWCDIAFGNGRFVVVAESDSSSTRRAVSTDGGITWTAGNISTGAIAIAYGGTRFVIVEGNFSNSAAYSTDGVTWVTATLPANADSTESDWRDVTFGNNRFVAIADNDARVAISLNGISWTGGQLPVNADWRHIAYGNGVFLALAENNVAATSPDGITWTTRNAYATDIDILSTSKDTVTDWSAGTATSTSNWYAIAHNGSNRYVMVGGDGVTSLGSYSSNGTSWIAGTMPAGGDGPRSVAFGSSLWVAPYSGSNDVATSSDGITFTFQSNVLPATRDWRTIAFGNGTFVTIDSSGTNSAATSTNGTTWTSRTMSASVEWTSVAYGTIGSTNYFVAVSGITGNSNSASYSTDNGATWTGSTLPSSTRWSSVAFGNGRFVAVSGNSGTTSSAAAYSTNGTTWSASTLPGLAAGWTNVTFNGSVFIATAYNTSRSAISEDGITWAERAMGATANWIASASDTANYETVVIAFNSSSIREIRYQANTNRLTVDNTTNLSVDDVITVPGDSAGVEIFGGLVRDRIYYITSIVNSTQFTISATRSGTNLTLSTGSGSMFALVGKVYTTIAYGNGGGNSGFLALGSNNRNAVNFYAGTTARARAYILDNKLEEIWINEPGSNYNSSSPPTMTIVDPNNTGADATHTVRVGNGALGQPMFTNRGTAYTSAAATIVGDGVADNYQTGGFVNFNNLSEVPVAGSNLVIDGIDDVYYKIVTVRNLTGSGPYGAQLQISPVLGDLESPEHATATTIRRRFSQVRLTGHDFLDIGTGNETETNYPGLPNQDPIPANETIQSGGGRVFWTSTDQDGNFRVGGLFNVEQATGTATLNAEAFNLAGLNELSLGAVALGGGGATINEFSTDPFFTADSDAIVPTQRAIKAYISSQIGGGSGSLNVNTITAGAIYIAGQTITTTGNEVININTTVNFTGGVDGYPVALNMFLQS